MTLWSRIGFRLSIKSGPHRSTKSKYIPINAIGLNGLDMRMKSRARGSVEMKIFFVLFCTNNFISLTSHHHIH